MTEEKREVVKVYRKEDLDLTINPLRELPFGAMLEKVFVGTLDLTELKKEWIKEFLKELWNKKTVGYNVGLSPVDWAIPIIGLKELCEEKGIKL